MEVRVWVIAEGVDREALLVEGREDDVAEELVVRRFGFDGDERRALDDDEVCRETVMPS